MAGRMLREWCIIKAFLTFLKSPKPVEITINAPGLAEAFIDLVVRHHGLPELDRQRLRLSLPFQVTIFLMLLLRH